jgi:hypothetical protein
MLQFDKVPVMDREYFEECLQRANRFAVWVQVNQIVQCDLPITREQAIEVAEYGFENGGCVWGMLLDGCLSVSLTSQWMSHLDEDKQRLQAIEFIDKVMK